MAMSLGLQNLASRINQPLTPADSQSKLWTQYRWSLSPQRRREASILLAAKDHDSPLRRQRLLAGQGWGTNPLAAVALKLQAKSAEQLGEREQARHRWTTLLNRFPALPSSADAYYSLGREQPSLRLELLQRHPAHPATLASAVELSKSDEYQNKGALHLALWGLRWPGTRQALKKACLATSSDTPSLSDRQVLAKGLAELGDTDAALQCLNKQQPNPAASLAIGRHLLGGNANSKKQGESLLLNLAQQHPDLDESLEAASLLSDQHKPKIELLSALPKELVNQSASVSAAMVRLNQQGLDKGSLVKAQEVLKRWPNKPSSWQLQWDLSRNALLSQNWKAAETILTSIATDQLPSPMAARQHFWWGFAVAKQGRDVEARKIWSDLIDSQPPGYYPWRAKTRLGLNGLHALSRKSFSEPSSSQSSTWQPLNSGDNLVDQLWRLGLAEEALDLWRSYQAERRADEQSSLMAKLIEGRLRIALGDYWTGLDKLWRVSLRMINADCSTRQILHRSQHPFRFLTEIKTSAQKNTISPELLLAITKQESRFSPGVTSIAGAQGLMQLMPATAAELAELSGINLTDEELLSPQTNINLGGRYLANLLEYWNDDPWLAIASYNAGPGAVSNWITKELTTDPELWVERIPYPETRYYTKKVLGNLFGYQNLNEDLCRYREKRARQGLAYPDTKKHNSTQGN